MLEAIRRHPVVTFFILAFPLSWYPWIVALTRGKTTGPNPLGPLVAGLIVSAVVYGRRGLLDFLRRLVRGNVGVQWYLVVFGVPIAMCSAAAALTVLSGAPMPKLDANWKELVDRFLFIFLFIGLGEEPGWRGFAIEHLQEKRSPLAASLVLAPLWALWHLPLMGNEFPLPIVPAFVISLFGATFFQTWLYNRTRGSVLLQALMHATVNTFAAGVVFQAFTGSALERLWWVYGFLWLVLGLAAILSARKAGVPVLKEA